MDVEDRGDAGRRIAIRPDLTQRDDVPPSQIAPELAETRGVAEEPRAEDR